ncbi:hypothetical protein PAHAL_9G102100 [Panicum hallii]|uniref:Uncharacterized protein n=1 Tax=Panicum hallii TaxID=206008 RepID=A0A2S3IJ01_9POAL|nr:hypothetical protein PAHAL_9G102100 [Panicum hallii]
MSEQPRRNLRAPCVSEMAQGSCYPPDEHYFPMPLGMKDPAGLARRKLTGVDWTGSVGGHPAHVRRRSCGPGSSPSSAPPTCARTLMI